MVNFPKGSIFVKSIDVSNVSKDVNLFLGILDKMVDEVGESNVVQVITDNTSAYVKTGKMLEAIRKQLYWTPCAAHCIDLMLEDIRKQIPRVKSCLKKEIMENDEDELVFLDDDLTWDAVGGASGANEEDIGVGGIDDDEEDGDMLGFDDVDIEDI
ncbi:hypothetical protein OSB04_007189 [Centaurea solstitialis]|uniref:DUF659 domain-containing protein n=1 Tax=Centaurea solstitialis TaxID=347529 RepID=A0AA38TL56_9ASTR|nr:hypothetical protein OSB04_007189 [Centaurea solstitialis]